MANRSYITGSMPEIKGNLKEVLNYLFDSNTLSKQEAYNVLTDIAGGRHNTSQIAAFLTVYCMRSITVEEMEGFRAAMLDMCHKVDFSGFETIDLCGTGGDGKDTFNISTLAAFVVAGAGVKVAKHGNYGVSSVCGSSNVLEFLGYKFTNERDVLLKQIEGAGVTILHAPMFHPAMKHIGPIRKELAFKTFFNMLGPMVNPADPQYQMVGVNSLELARLYNYLYQQTSKNYVIVHTTDGYDELSLTAPAKIIRRQREQIVNPEEMGLKHLQQLDIIGGTTIEESAKIFQNVLEGKGSKEQNEVVIANAAIAINCVRREISWEDSVASARESLASGAAMRSFKMILEN